jgi:hypothetical protein
MNMSAISSMRLRLTNIDEVLVSKTEFLQFYELWSSDK